MRIGSIQALRAIAANMVVVSHLAVVEVKYGHGHAILPSGDDLGRLGVHLFFVISGFVIAMVAEAADDWRSFLWARVSRIYPIYWFYTAIVLAVAASAPGMVNSSVAGTPSLWRSIFLFPDYTLPWLAVGWSLVYEMYFYISITVILAVRLNLWVGLVCWAIVPLLPIAPESPISTVILSPLTYEFIGGAVLWLLLSKSGMLRYDLQVPILSHLGDASYSIYLSHVLVLSALGRVFYTQPWHSNAAEALFIVAAVVAVNGLGWLSYRYVEKPILDLSRSGLIRRPRPLGM